MGSVIGPRTNSIESTAQRAYQPRPRSLSYPGHRATPSPWNQPLVPALAALACGIAIDAFFGPTIFTNFSVLRHGERLIIYSLIGVALLILWAYLCVRRSVGLSRFALFLSVVLLGATLHYWHTSVFSQDELGRYALALDTQPGGPSEGGGISHQDMVLDAARDHDVSAICMEATLESVPEVIATPGLHAQPSLRRVLPWQNQATTILRCRAVSIRDGTVWRFASGTLEIYVRGSLPRLLPGDRLRLTGHLASPRRPDNPGQFDLRSYRRGDRVLVELRDAQAAGVEMLERGTVLGIPRLLAMLRISAAEAIERFVSQPQAALAKALLLGFRREVDDEFSERLLRTGTIHLLAISGLHIGIFAGTVLVVLRWIGVRGRAIYILALLSVLTYLMISGGKPPTVRAAVILSIYFLGKALLRRSSGWNSLAFAGLAVLICNPSDLFRVGPQLSFLIAATLVAFGGKIASRGPEDPLARVIFEARPRWQRALIRAGSAIGQSVAISGLLATVTAPLVMARFHVAAPLGIILTPLLLPPLSVVLAFGFGLMLLGPWCWPLGWLCGSVCDITLRLIRAIVDVGDGIPYAVLWSPGPPDWWLIGLYAIGAGLVFVPYRRAARYAISAAILAWTLLLFGYAIAVPRVSRGTVECAVLSVGHGLAIAIHLPGGRILLYDAGKMLGDRTAAQTVANYLWYRGVTHIDAIIISHADFDHYGAVPRLLDYFSVGKIYLEPSMIRSSEPLVRELLEAIRAKNVPLATLAENWEAWPTDEIHLSVLHPPQNWIEGEDNAKSLVLRVQCGDSTLMLTGDLDGRGTQRILGRSDLACSVLVAPHHGSRNGNSPAWIRRVRPPIVVMSNGRALARDVSEGYRAVGSKILETRRHGAVAVILTRSNVQVKPFHAAPDDG